MSSTRNPELQKLHDELNRTTVISEDFKEMIIRWTDKALEWQAEDIKNQKKKKAKSSSKRSSGPRIGCLGLDPNDPI